MSYKKMKGAKKCVCVCVCVCARVCVGGWGLQDRQNHYVVISTNCRTVSCFEKSFSVIFIFF